MKLKSLNRPKMVCWRRIARPGAVNRSRWTGFCRARAIAKENSRRAQAALQRQTKRRACYSLHPPSPRGCGARAWQASGSVIRPAVASLAGKIACIRYRGAADATSLLAQAESLGGKVLFTIKVKSELRAWPNRKQKRQRAATRYRFNQSGPAEAEPLPLQLSSNLTRTYHSISHNHFVDNHVATFFDVVDTDF